MIIPSLLLLDNRDANQTIILANVYPHEEIFILKDALNKLLDERNSLINESTNLQPSPRQSHPSQSRKGNSPERRETIRELHSPVTTRISQVSSSNGQPTISVKSKSKNQINELQSYSQCMKTTNKVNENFNKDMKLCTWMTSMQPNFSMVLTIRVLEYWGVMQNKKRVHNVQLPQWCKENPYVFIYFMRKCLEEKFVRGEIHKWIDLIFGKKQRGQQATKALNCYYYFTYEAAVPWEILKNERYSIHRITDSQFWSNSFTNLLQASS